MNARRKRSLQNFSNAVSRLDEALALVSQQSEPPDLLIDGAIQRFEFVIEIAWKNLKRALQEEGVEALTPRESISKAFAAQWIDDEDLWLNMLRDRNQTSHIYNREMARQIFERFSDYAVEFRRLLEFLTQRHESTQPEA